VLGREATRDEIARAMNIAARDVDKIEEAREAPVVVEIAIEAPSLDDRLDTRDRTRELRDAIEALPERLQSVLSFRYVEELTLKEIASVLGVSEPRICQLHHAAIVRLRKAMG
jgi:RNA polymerase sigma factor FliA